MNKGTFLAKWRPSSLMKQDLDALLYSEYKKGLNDDREYNEAKIKAARKEVRRMILDLLKGLSGHRVGHISSIRYFVYNVFCRAYKERFGQ